MKKILLASTMLVAATVAAKAEVTLSGDARMGIIAAKGADAAFTSRARVAFGLTGETDNGLTFGASFRADNAGNAAAGTAGSVNVAGAFGKLTMGDTDGAAGAAVGQVSGTGLINDGDKNEILYLANGGLDIDPLTFNDYETSQALSDVSGSTALYEYTTGAISFYGSVANPSGAVKANSLAVKYSTDAYSVSVGYETAKGTTVFDDDSSSLVDSTSSETPVDLRHIVLGASATVAGATLKAVYGLPSGTVDGDKLDGSQYALSAGYTVSGVDVTAFYRVTDLKLDNVSIADSKGAGIGAGYDLGGGASFKAGAYRASGEKPTFDAGLSFSF